MDLIFEIIFSLVIEGSFELGTNKKISKWIRYPLLFMLLCIYLGIVALFTYLGISVYKTNVVFGIVIWIITITLVLGIIFAFKKKYKEVNGVFQNKKTKE